MTTFFTADTHFNHKPPFVELLYVTVQGGSFVIVKCDWCGAPIKKSPSHVGSTNFCTSGHHRLWMKKNQKGVNNPNYGKKWGRKQREAQSTRVREKMRDPQVRFACGANRGKVFSTQTRKRMSRGHLGKPGPSHTLAAKRVIGFKSRAKWTPDFKRQFRKTMEKLGHWIPLEQKSTWEIYFMQTEWVERMFDRVTPEEKQLLKRLGVFSKKNTKGVVRDHAFSRKSGFELKVFPELLRHPANCRIITHAQNISQAQNKRYNDDVITLSELFHRIREYGNDWVEQVYCLQLIRLYKNGLRWKCERGNCVCSGGTQ